jgi:hypothetical protein
LGAISKNLKFTIDKMKSICYNIEKGGRKMCEKARELFKKGGLAKMTNTRLIKYGKITDNIAYELVQRTDNSYTEAKNDKDKEHLCMLSFVKKENGRYIFDTDECVNGSLQEMLVYIADCKREKRIIKKEEK